MNEYESCPNPNRCLFTGCAGDCPPPRLAAAAPGSTGPFAELARPQTAPLRFTDASLRHRDALAHRKLLVTAHA